jgi:hypothetical protein
MRRTERRLFALADEIAHLHETRRQVEAELAVLEHLHDDAKRDAAVGGPIEREDDRESGRDVARFVRLLSDLTGRIERLEAKRRRMLGGLQADD